MSPLIKQVRGPVPIKFSIPKNLIFILILSLGLNLLAGCASSPDQPTGNIADTLQKPKLFVIILDALRRNNLMESLDSLPNFKMIIKGEKESYPYIYFENVLVSIPSSSKPVNTTLLTGVYPRRHGVPSTMWFDRKGEKIITLTTFSQRRIIEFLEKTETDTVFEYAHRSGKTTMAVATQVTKGVADQDWIKQGIHLWSQAFFANLFGDGKAIPDGAHLDRGTTKGLLGGYMYSLTDGLKGELKTEGDIPDFVVLHYVGLDIFTHYPRKFMEKENWNIDQIQHWYLREVLDPELGKLIAFLKENNIFENTIFFFAADHGQTRITRHIDEQNFEKDLAKKFRLMGQPYSAGEADLIVMPGASTKAIYVRRRTGAGWMGPPRLFEDVKPVVDSIIDLGVMKKHLSTLLVAQYPGERHEGREESDAFWFFNLNGYRQSERKDEDFLKALEPLSNLDEWVGKELHAAHMYRLDYARENTPDIILINMPGTYFTPDEGKYAHHGSIYAGDAYVSFAISGPGIHLFSSKPQTITRQINTVDMVPMAAHLGGFKIDKPIDGKNHLSGLK
jgi:predicted AlkP superfamily pyrophosphatase or phosphodiesterase